MEYPLEIPLSSGIEGIRNMLCLRWGTVWQIRDGREKGTVCWLDGNGNEKGSFASGESVTYLHAAEKGIVVGNDRDYTGVTYSGQ